MAHKKNMKGNSFVVLDDGGFMQMYSPNGDRIECNIMLRVKDTYDGLPEVFGKWIVNIVGSVDEMHKEIEKYKNNK